MRNPAELHTGDDWTPAITLTQNGSVYAVPPGATVRAAITDQDGLNILAGPVTVLEATSGSDWANGVIVPIFPASLTVDLPTGYARTEVEVLHDGNVSTWSMSRTPRIEPGVITNLTLEPEPGESLSDINAAELGSGAATDGYVLTADGAGGADWEAVPAGGGGLTAADIDTLAELNAIVADATLIDTSDSRLSDARTPTAHAASHATGGSDALTPAAIGAATAAQGDTADTAVQPARAVNSGIGLDGGGNLSADRTLALNAAAIASLALADTSTQPGDDADTLGSGSAADGQVLTADGLGGAAWEAAAGGSAAGADGQVQFALSGGFSADAGLAYNSNTKALNVGGATVTADSPVLNLAQTWNNVAVTFTGALINITDTASAATSPLLDLQVDGVSQVRVLKDSTILMLQGFQLTNYLGLTTSARLYPAGSGILAAASNGGRYVAFGANGVLASRDGYIGWHGAAFWGLTSSTPASDLTLYRDAADTLNQRRTTNPQTFRITNTWTDASNLEHLSIGWAANVCTIATEALGTGTKRNIVLDGANRAAYSETPADIAAALVAHGIMSPA